MLSVLRPRTLPYSAECCKSHISYSVFIMPRIKYLSLILPSPLFILFLFMILFHLLQMQPRPILFSSILQATLFPSFNFPKTYICVIIMSDVDGNLEVFQYIFQRRTRSLEKLKDSLRVLQFVAESVPVFEHRTELPFYCVKLPSHSKTCPPLYEVSYWQKIMKHVICW